MLTSITLQNFKCFEDLTLPLRRISVLIGPNGSGKSSVLQALMLLRQSLGKAGLEVRGLVDLSGPGPVVFRGSAGRSLMFAFEAARSMNESPAGLDYKLEVAADLHVIRQHGRVIWGTMHLEAFWTPAAAYVNPEYEPSRMQANGTTGEPFKPANDLDREPELKGLIDLHRQEIESWRFVPAIRGFSRAAYNLQEKSIDYLHVGTYHESASDALASALAYRRTDRRRISSWIEEVTGVPVDSSLAEGRLTVPEAISPVAERHVPLVNEGFGTNQLVFLMFQLANAPAEGLVGVEEPEVHLHPLAIARLGDLFVRVAADENKQLLLTTHSDHLLYCLLNNVAEGKLAPDDLAIHYFERQDHEIVVSPVEVTAEGQVKGGLPGFLDAALEAQRRKIEALSRAS